MARRALLACPSAAVLVELLAQPGAAVNVPQAVVVSSNLAAAPDGLHATAWPRSALAAVDPVTGALDPVNGLPLSWNPGRDRGVGAFVLVATSQGLWIGSGTDRIGRYEYHGRIAFMPLAGGTPVPESRVGTLPGDLFRLGARPRSPLPHQLHHGMCLWNSRLYYTLSGDTRLYYRWSPRQRRPRRRHLHRQRRHRRPQLVDRQRRDHGLRPPRLRHHHRDGPERPAVDGQSWQSRGLLVLNLHLTGSELPARPTRCGPDPFRYPAPRRPL